VYKVQALQPERPVLEFDLVATLLLTGGWSGHLDLLLVSGNMVLISSGSMRCAASSFVFHNIIVSAQLQQIKTLTPRIWLPDSRYNLLAYEVRSARVKCLVLVAVKWWGFMQRSFRGCW
jgi:hypothetical protein